MKKINHSDLEQLLQNSPIAMIVNIKHGCFSLQRSLSYLLTPFPDHEVARDIEKAIFNKLFCGKRVVIEHIIGILKRKFKILKNGIPFRDMEKVSQIIQGDFILQCKYFN